MPHFHQVWLLFNLVTFCALFKLHASKWLVKAVGPKVLKVAYIAPSITIIQMDQFLHSHFCRRKGSPAKSGIASSSPSSPSLPDPRNGGEQQEFQTSSCSHIFKITYAHNFSPTNISIEVPPFPADFEMQTSFFTIVKGL